VKELPLQRAIWEIFITEGGPVSKFRLTTWVWGFIVAVAVADVYFTWECQGTTLVWELNPVAVGIFQSGGVVAVALYRVGLLAYAAAMSCVKTRFTWLVTPIWGAGHLYLFLILVRVYPYLTILRR
jgi:hypothetical protein